MKQLLKIGKTTYIDASTIVQISEVQANSYEAGLVDGYRKSASTNVFDCAPNKKICSIIIDKTGRVYLSDSSRKKIFERMSEMSDKTEIE